MNDDDKMLATSIAMFVTVKALLKALQECPETNAIAITAKSIAVAVGPAVERDIGSERQARLATGLTNEMNDLVHTRIEMLFGNASKLS